MDAPALDSLEIKLFQFLTYIPDDSPLSYTYDHLTGTHRFMNSEGYMEWLELTSSEFCYLVQQQRLPGKATGAPW